MSGIEVLGVAASAAQLVGLLVEITKTVCKVTQKLKTAPSQLELHLAEVRQLVDTANWISETPCLHTPTISAHLQSAQNEAEKLNKILERISAYYKSTPTIQRYFKIVAKGLPKEEQIKACFLNLEQRKSALILCITASQSDRIVSIQNSVELLVEAASWDPRKGLPTSNSTRDTTITMSLPSEDKKVVTVQGGSQKEPCLASHQDDLEHFHDTEEQENSTGTKQPSKQRVARQSVTGKAKTGGSKALFRFTKAAVKEGTISKPSPTSPMVLEGENTRFINNTTSEEAKMALLAGNTKDSKFAGNKAGGQSRLTAGNIMVSPDFWKDFWN